MRFEVHSNVRWLFTSGTPGLEVDGTLSSDITGQTELAYQHILRIVEEAGMTLSDVVKITQYVRPEEYS